MKTISLLWAMAVCALATGTSFALFRSSTRPSPAASCTPFRVEYPDHPSGLELIITQARQSRTPVSLQGSGYSQGWQSCAHRGIQINLQELNQLINLDIGKRLVTVQAGMTWQRLQEHLAFFGLSVAAMQSYNDFTIGGSLGVNAHGQDVHWNPVSASVESIKVLLTDGRYLHASRTTNSDLFRAAIGSYGLVGIITEVTLTVVPNRVLQKRTQLIKTRDYNRFFASLRSHKDLALHSARLSINPLRRFHNLVVVNYFDTQKQPPSVQNQATPDLPNPKYLNLIKASWFARAARTTAEYFFLEREGTMTRNQAMGESVLGLKNTRPDSRDILQEYFIPEEQLQTFIHELDAWVSKNTRHFTLVNATIRRVNADQDTLMPYAPDDRFAVVLFINLPDSAAANQTMEEATRQLIDTALALKGRYYLPYALYASRDQFHRAYPEFRQLIEAKNIWDKEGLLTNQLYHHYR